MKLEDQVCSLELAKRLKELGVKQESLFYWVLIDNLPTPQLVTLDETSKLHLGETFRSAFTVAELGEMIPDSCYTKKDNAELKKVWLCHLSDFTGKKNIELENTEADARAKMLIYLIENKLIEIPK